MFDLTTDTEDRLLDALPRPRTATTGGMVTGRMLFVMHGENSCAGHIGQALRSKGYRIECRKPRFGCHVPASLADYDGVVVFGGPMSCNDNEPWITAEIGLAARALAEDKPFLGVCLGAQMLARALGATVARHPANTVEIGYYALEPTAAGQGLGPWPDYVYHWHREGFELPHGATLLARGTGAFPHQAFAYGRAAAVQFHPEITYALINRWMTSAAAKLAEPGARPADTHRPSHLRYQPHVRRWLDGFLDHWLAGRLIQAAHP